MNIFFRCLALSPLLALVAACCANSAADCNDLQADSLYLTLNQDPNDPKSFTPAELDTVYIQRYSLTDPTALSDPRALVRAQRRSRALVATLRAANLDTTTLVISNLTPFQPSVVNGKLSAYNYLLTVKDGAKGAQPAVVFYINNIVLSGNYEADGCTTCYRNTEKTFQVNRNATAISTPNVVTETGGVPIPVVLSKP